LQSQFLAPLTAEASRSEGFCEAVLQERLLYIVEQGDPLEVVVEGVDALLEAVGVVDPPLTTFPIPPKLQAPVP